MNLIALRKSESRAWNKFSVSLEAEIFIVGEKKETMRSFSHKCIVYSRSNKRTILYRN